MVIVNWLLIGFVTMFIVFVTKLDTSAVYVKLKHSCDLGICIVQFSNI